MKNIKLYISPCPNDTFIFDALVNKKIDTGNYNFEIVFLDIQQLNTIAEEKDIDLIKLSYNKYFDLYDKYLLMRSGGALGDNCGPLLITKNIKSLQDLSGAKVAIPGLNTTAFFLYNYAIKRDAEIIEMPFNKIEDAILNNEVDAGVIIHENRFTYKQKGLKKILDLGEYWQQNTSFPIPLGGIALNRRFSEHESKEINNYIRKSIEFAFANPESSSKFVKTHAQEIDYDVMQSHIKLYVNDYSLDIGGQGIAAVKYMAEVKGINLDKEIFNKK